MTEQPKRGWLGILLENYSFFLSALYLFATAIGLIYSGVLYGNFGINIFDYSEISDFLLVAFKNPAVFLPTGIATIVSLVVVGVNESSYRRYQRRRPDNELSETPSELEQADYSVSRQRRRAIIIS